MCCPHYPREIPILLSLPPPTPFFLSLIHNNHGYQDGSVLCNYLQGKPGGGLFIFYLYLRFLDIISYYGFMAMTLLLFLERISTYYPAQFICIISSCVTFLDIDIYIDMLDFYASDHMKPTTRNTSTSPATIPIDQKLCTIF